MLNKTHLGLCLLALVSLGLFTACDFKKAEVGTKDNPIKLFFVPSVDAKVINDTSEHIKTYLEKATPYKYRVSVPTSYVAVVEAFGSKRADIASLNTFGYILAREKYQAEARITVLRHGKATYRSQIIASKKSGIQTLKDINGKKVAFVDPASTSGYLLPMKLFKDKDIQPKESVFANKHDNVVSMIYQGQVDAGATFYSPPEEGEIQDARRLVKTQYPDVEEKVRIVELTEPIPNDPIVFRQGLKEKLKKSVTQAFMDYIQTEEGKSNFKQLYGVTDLKLATDADYDGVRDMLKKLGQSAASLLKK